MQYSFLDRIFAARLKRTLVRGAVAVGQSLQQLSPSVFLDSIVNLTVLSMLSVMICRLENTQGLTRVV